MPQSQFSSYWTAESPENTTFDHVLYSNLTNAEKQSPSLNPYYLTCKNNTINEIKDYGTYPYISEPLSAYCNLRPANGNINAIKSLSEKIPGIIKSPVATAKVSSPQTLHSNFFSTSNKAIKNISSNKDENTWPFFGYNSNSQRKSYILPMNKHKSNGHTGLCKSPSSNFICSKCGLGYPCTLFLCKRKKSLYNCRSEEQKSKSLCNSAVRNEVIDSNLSNNLRLENDNSKSVYYSENTSVLALKKADCLPSTEENIDFLISGTFSEDVKREYISNKELTNEDKMQSKDEAAEFNASNTECITNVKNILFSKNSNNMLNKQEVLETSIKGNKDVGLDHLTIPSSAGSFHVKADNQRTFDKPNSFKAFDSLSEETSKFLNELALSSAGSNTFNEDNAYDIAPIASEILNSKIADDAFTEHCSTNICQTVSKSSSEGENQCNINDVSKDVTNALDLIEQSSLYDRNLSSAEICNSLNQIFNESGSTDLPASVPVAELVQTEEIQSGLESSSLPDHVNNDSEIYLQAEETSTSVSAETETYINLSDLCSGNSNNVQSILLIQDATGNVETMFLIDDALNKEGTASLIQNITSNGEGIVLTDGFKVEDVLQNQLLADGENVFVDIASNQVQNLVITQDISTNSENATLDFQNKDELSDNLLTVNNTVISENNLNGQHLFIIQDTSNEGKNMVNVVEGLDKTMLSEEKNEKINEEQNTILIRDVDCVESISKENIINENENMCETFQNAEKSNSISTVCEKFNMVKSPDLISFDANVADISEDNNLNCSQENLKAKKSILYSTLIGVNENVGSKSCGNTNFPKKEFSQNCNQSLQSSSKVTPNFLKVDEISVNTAFDYKSDRIFSDKVGNCNQISPLIAGSCTGFPKLRSIQKSKKSSVCKLMKRSAKKSVLTVGDKSDFNYPQSCDASYSSDSVLMNKTLDNNQSYHEFKNLILKRKDRNILNNQNIYKRKKMDELDCVLNNDSLNECNNFFNRKSHFVALKTFKKPFTAAKKSLSESREGMQKNLKNKALKSFVPQSHLFKTALKSVRKPLSEEINKSITTAAQILSTNTNINTGSDTASNLHYNPQLKIYIQPEISEIRILPNECLKRVTNLLQNPHTYESVNTVEDNVSDEDEVKLSSEFSSPVEEFLPFKPFCTCSAKEVPCICNDYNLQSICEGEDSVDGTNVRCTKVVSKQYLLTPSSEIRYRAFCDIHLARLRLHHCCPKCGIFCSQGTFNLCSSELVEDVEDHLFHLNCSLIPAPGLPPACPHCCRFSEFKSVNLIYKSVASQENKEVPSNSKNITNELNDCDIFMTVNPVFNQQDVVDTPLFLPEKNEVKRMISSLSKEKTLRLRPTGKCLYNPIKTGDVQKVMQLIGNGINPNHKFRMHSNNTPLHVAAYYGWIGILHILLQAEAQIDAVNDDLETALIVAVERNQLHIVRYLVFAGAQIDVKDCNGMTSFHIASKNGFREIAEFLYSTGLIDINLQDDGGWTALVWACEHKHVLFVKWLLDIGADPNVRDNEENTVLHWAAYSGKSEIAELLLAKGCTLSYVNKRGDSALHIASRENNHECVKLFASRGAVLDLKNKENKTPLMCCEDDSMSWNFLCQCISSGTLKIGKMQLEKHVVFRDISRGAEAYPIQAINEVDDEEFIMEFRYVIKNCHRSGVDIMNTVNQMVFCYCKDNCLTRDCHCFLNSKCWYDTNGCLVSEFELLSPPVIFECNKTCHCPKTCINRVVQQGLRCPLQLFRTKYQGWGVRTLQDLPKGAFVCEYVGELITGSEATLRDDDTYFFDLESKDSDYCLDGRYYGNVARFINHSCEPNLMAAKVFVDHQDLNFPRIAFFTLRNIQAFEELCFDYGLDFWISKSQSILCTCNTQSCKYSKDTIDETLEKFFMDTES